jgi:hypothetical protein
MSFEAVAERPRANFRIADHPTADSTWIFSGTIASSDCGCLVPSLSRYYPPHRGLKVSYAFGNWAKTDMSSYFEILRRRAVIRRPFRRTIEIGIAGFDELCPIAAHEISQIFIFARVFPVIGKRIG